MRKHNVTVADIKFFVNFKTESICVDKTENAGRTLAGNNGTNLFARAACFKSSLFKKKNKLGDFIIRNALNFNGHTSCHGNLGRAEFVRRLGNGSLLVGCYLTVFGYNSDIEDILKPFVTKTAECLDRRNLRCGQLVFFRLNSNKLKSLFFIHYDIPFQEK